MDLNISADIILYPDSRTLIVDLFISTNGCFVRMPENTSLFLCEPLSFSPEDSTPHSVVVAPEKARVKIANDAFVIFIVFPIVFRYYAKNAQFELSNPDSQFHQILKQRKVDKSNAQRVIRLSLNKWIKNSPNMETIEENAKETPLNMLYSKNPVGVYIDGSKQRRLYN